MRNSNTVSTSPGGDDDDKPSRTANKVAVQQQKPQKIPTRKKTVRPTSVAKWHAVPPNPRQPRDQVERAPKAKHLHKFVPGLHEEVYMAEDPLGNVCKLTAHTRGEVWFSGLSDAIPDPVQVTVIPVKDMEEAGRLCQFYDSREAVNTSADLIHGALMYHGVPMTSPLLMKAVGLPTPLRYSYEVMLSCYRQSKNPSVRELADAWPAVKRATAIDFVAAFKDELAALDGLNPGAKRGTTKLFRSPLTTAFLLAAKKYGQQPDKLALLLSFCEKMQDGTCGCRRGRKRDPVGYAEDVLKEREGGARAEHFECVVAILAAIEIYVSRNYGSRYMVFDENGKKVYRPPVDIENLIGVDLDVYLTSNSVRRTGRAGNRNSVLKDKRKN
jgi:hypothetical protein